MFSELKIHVPSGRDRVWQQGRRLGHAGISMEWQSKVLGFSSEGDGNWGKFEQGGKRGVLTQILVAPSACRMEDHVGVRMEPQIPG